MAAPTAAATSAAAATATVGLSNGGKAFFGGLTAGTFGLGCWQLQRLLAKWDMMETRENELSMDPTTKWNTAKHPYRRRVVQGVFRYDKEILVGPRGAPPGVRLPRHGLSRNSSNSGGGGGMVPGPQGFHVLTPLQVPILNPDGTQKSERLLWVNRGWVPKTMVPDPRRSGNSSSSSSGGGGQKEQPNQNMLNWNRPEGKVTVVAIRSELESTYPILCYKQPSCDVL
jgi:cytochrome oxidase assembly protein ShyY1